MSVQFPKDIEDIIDRAAANASRERAIKAAVREIIKRKGRVCEAWPNGNEAFLEWCLEDAIRRRVRGS
jgi:hypothetical protein